MMWLKDNPVDKWSAVDDLDLDINIFKEDMRGHFVQTLAGIHLVKDKIINILNETK